MSIPLAERRLTHGQQLAYSAFWAATNFIWGALLVVVIASQVGQIAPQHKAQIVGGMLSLGAIPALIVPLIIGPLSDRCSSRLGRRRPYILFGTIVNLFGLVLMYGAGEWGNIPVFIATYFLLQVGNNIATAAYSGVIPDLVPVGQRGMASGYMAVMSQLGTLSGVLSSGYLASGHRYLLIYSILFVVLLCGMLVTLAFVKETPLEKPPPRLNWAEHIKSLWIDPRTHSDFAWVWLTRALVMLGFYAVLPFIQYFLGDVIGDPEPARTSASVSALVLLAAVVSGYIGGHLSDKLGRKKIVYVANGFMALMCVGLVFCTTLEWTLAVGTLFGFGYGAYISVDWALGTDVLPNPHNAAKDMAVWHVSMTLPQALAALPAGFLIASFGTRIEFKRSGPGGALLGYGGDLGAEWFTRHYEHAGYAALFLAAGSCLALGALLLRNVKGSR